MSNQLDPIIAILERDGQIDNFQAIEKRLSLRLGARIQDLETKGYVFRTERCPDKNYIYRLVSKPAPKQLNLV